MDEKNIDTLADNIATIIVSFIFIFVWAWVGQWMWNTLMPSLFGLPTLTYTQALLMKIMFSVFTE